jgi:large-conductance mechanosensitive channel
VTNEYHLLEGEVLTIHMSTSFNFFLKNIYIFIYNIYNKKNQNLKKKKQIPKKKKKKKEGLLLVTLRKLIKSTVRLTVLFREQ